LRTRKKHELEYVKTRLVALDYVLGRPEHRYLETEAEKVAFFEKEWNVRRETLPVKQYRARRSAEITPRYFVDRFPMIVDRLSSSPVVTFAYADAGAVTLEAFGTHLRAYLGLFQALPELEFIYLAPTARLFQAAESEFYHVLYGARDHSKSINVLDYFRIRRAWEAKERVSSADVVLLKEAQERYAGRQYEEMYEKWRRGAIADAEVTQHSKQVGVARKGVFRTMLCGSSLSVFSDPRGNGAENYAEGVIADGSPQVSSNRSFQISGT
jgi:plasmid maintenance system killer protein